MAHNITERDNLFTVREPAWHGLGEVLTDYPTLSEAKAIAHPWEPVSEPLYRQVVGFDADGNPTTSFEKVDGHVAVVRDDETGSAALGVVGEDSYGIVNNQEMYDVAEAIQGEGGEVLLETGGSLKGGRKVWLLLRLNEPLVVPGDPNGATIAYYALQNSHDGSGSFRGQATMSRIVCDNTAQMADLDAQRRGTEFTFRHSVNVRDRIEEAKSALAGWRKDVEQWNDLQRHMVTVRVTPEQREEFIERFIPAPHADIISSRVRTNIETARGDLRTIFASPTMEGIAGTAYGLVQAAVEYSEHYRRTAGRDTDGRSPERARAEAKFYRAYLHRNDLAASATRIVRDLASV